MNAVTEVLGGHVEPPGDGQSLVDHQQLAVTADRQSTQRQRVENPNLTAGQSQRIKEPLIEGRRTQTIDQDTNRDTTTGHTNQCVTDGAPRVPIGINVSLQTDTTPRSFDRSDQS